ncbi:heme o synthase [Hirschia litorea]|uniref:Protoheme IX farnesyltransferase n=1 Tax=Hirschia litorea TaxID=1199156 RepID=A0ABW2IJG9_9PROT
MSDLTNTLEDDTRMASFGDYVQLMKPRVMMLVVFTAFAGLIAAPGSMNWVTAASAVLAVALASGAAGALNMWYDHDIDAVMKRTMVRPVPAGLIPRDEALGLGLIMSAVSVTIMALASNPLAAGLLAFSIFFYAVVYTIWLKRSTSQNIVIGGAAGAFPPMIGWAAATGDAPLNAWLLFAIIFFWTPPHFWALSLWTSKEYGKAGVPMLPVTHGAKHTRLQILLYSILLLPLGMVPVATGLGGYAYLVAAFGLGVWFLWAAIRVFMSKAGDDSEIGENDLPHAKRLFGISIVYLFALFGVLAIEQGLGLYFATPFVWGGLS